MRPVFEQESFDRLEEVVVDDDGLEFIVGGEVGGQCGQILTETERVKSLSHEKNISKTCPA